MSSHPSSFSRGYLIALVSALFLSTTAIFIRHLTLTYQVPALVLAFWRDVFVVLTLLPVLRWFHPDLLKVKRSHLLYLCLYGLLLALFNSLWTLSVALNGAAVATVLVYSSAAFTVLLGWWLLKEGLGWVKILAVVLCLAGCVLVSGATDVAYWNKNWVSILTGVLAGLSYAVYSLMGRSASTRGLNPWSTLLYIFAFAAVFLLLINLLPLGFLPGKASHPLDLFWLKTAWAGWGILFLLAAVPTIAGFGLLLVSLTYLPSSIANLIVTTEPVFTAITAYFLLGEQLNGAQIFGGLLILAGVVFIRVYEGWMEQLTAKKKALLITEP
jgi:drug/metabolite transporter (DMT)-like permease